MLIISSLSHPLVLRSQWKMRKVHLVMVVAAQSFVTSVWIHQPMLFQALLAVKVFTIVSFGHCHSLPLLQSWSTFSSNPYSPISNIPRRSMWVTSVNGISIFQRSVSVTSHRFDSIDSSDHFRLTWRWRTWATWISLRFHRMINCLILLGFCRIKSIPTSPSKIFSFLFHPSSYHAITILAHVQQQTSSRSYPQATACVTHLMRNWKMNSRMVRGFVMPINTVAPVNCRWVSMLTAINTFRTWPKVSTVWLDR